MRNGFLHLLTPPSHTWQKKCSRNRTCVTTQPSYLFTVWESGVSVCGILFFGVDTWPKRHSQRTREKIYIRLSKIIDRKKQYDFPERISECRLRRGMGWGVGTYDKHLTFFYFTLSSRNDSPNDPTFFLFSLYTVY